MKSTSSVRFLVWSLAFWLGLAVVAVLNAGLREAILEGLLEPVLSLLISGVLLGAIILMVACLMVFWIGRPDRSGVLWLAGGLWATLMVGFEMLMMVYVRGGAMVDLWAVYHPARILEGELIVFVLILTAAAPYLAARIVSTD